MQHILLLVQYNAIYDSKGIVKYSLAYDNINKTCGRPLVPKKVELLAPFPYW